jgi:hypothetical protein
MNSQQQLKKAERAWYRAKAYAEQAADRVSDCEKKLARLREELNFGAVLGRTPSGPKRQSAENARKTEGALKPRRRFRISFTEREHASILAALRLWQRDAAHVANGDGSILGIAEEAGNPLTNKEVDELCERINFTHRKV